MITNSAKDTWDLLAERTQRASRLWGSTTWDDIHVMSSRSRVILKPGSKRFIQSLFLLAVGIIVIFLSLIRTHNPLPGILFGLLSISTGFFILHYIKHISWKTDGNDILISYDLGPFHKKIKLDKSQLAAQLDICSQDIKDTNVRIGAVMLCIERTDCAKQQLIIAISGNGAHLHKAFEKLSEFLGGHQTDSTLEGIRLSQGQQVLIPTYKENEPDFLGQKDRKVVMSSNDLIILKRNWGDTIILFLGVGIGIFGLIATFILYNQEQSKNTRFWITEGLVCIAGLSFSTWCLWQLIQFFRGWYLIADKKNDALMLSGVIPSISKPSLLCKLSAIGAFQLCSFIVPGRYMDNIYYRLHAVLNNPLSTRLVMYSSIDREEISEQAKMLAKFLQVPFYDHVLASD